VAIIGAGPAGIAASIYLKRAALEPLIFEKDKIGGLLLNANLIENYPGFPGGINGKGLVQLFKEQISRLGIDVKKEEVKKVSYENGIFTLKTDKIDYKSKAMIVATGTEPKSIEVEGQSSLLGRKVFYEIKDIPPLIREDTFVILGGGDAAFDYALNLSKNVSKVDIIFRSDKAKCLPLLEERVRKSKNINVHPKTLILAMEGEGARVFVKCTSGGKEKRFSSNYALIACGRKPNLSLLPEKVRESLIIQNDGATNIPGLFIAGDVRRGYFRQTGIAVGDGILCAMSAVNFLRGE
jgi:thioredoxin reductase (NADPH)